MMKKGHSGKMTPLAQSGNPYAEPTACQSNGKSGRARARVWLAITALCVLVTIYEIPRATVIWRCMRPAVIHRLKLQGKEVLAGVLPEEIVAADPEAAEIVIHSLTDPNRDDLADRVARFPENEFFLAQLAYQLQDANLVDPRIPLSIIDRLIAQRPDNAHYHYIKGHVLLTSCGNGTRALEALEQFKRGNDLSDFTLPYELFQQRIDRLCDRVGIDLSDRRQAAPSQTGWNWALARFLQRSRGAYSHSSRQLSHAIDAEVSRMADRIINRATTRDSLHLGACLLLLSEGKRFRELDLSEEQARQLRFRLARATEIVDLFQQHDYEKFDLGYSLMKILLVVGLLGFFLPTFLALILLLMLHVKLRGREQNVSGGIGLLARLQSTWRVFRRNRQIVIKRMKTYRLERVMYLFAWVAVLMGIHLSAPKCARLAALEADPLLPYRPLPQADRASYERVLSQKHATDPNAPVRPAYSEDRGLPKNLRLAFPEDLYAVLDERRAAGQPVPEESLLRLMRRCGHDARAVVVQALKDPNALDALMRRAEWEDMSVKNQLDRIFEEKLVRLEETLSPIHEDPNSIDSLIVRLRWGDETAEEALEQAVEAKIVDLTERVTDISNGRELRVELKALLKMSFALPWAGSPALDDYGLMLMMKDPMSPYGLGDPNARKEMQEGRDRHAQVRELIVDANMPELLEDDADEDNIHSGHLISLIDLAGALAFISEPEEAAARFQLVMDLTGESRGHNRASAVPWPQSSCGSGVWQGRLWWKPSVFYRALVDVPRPAATTVFKAYAMHGQMAGQLMVHEATDLLHRVGDSELAEWVFLKVADSSPPMEVLDLPSGMPLGDLPSGMPLGFPFTPSDASPSKRRKDVSHRYLESVFPHFIEESIPFLLEHLGSDNDQLRAFIVWRVSSLAHAWTGEQLSRLKQDSYWKVRLNSLFAVDRQGLVDLTEDERPLIRTVAQILLDSEAG